MLKAKSAGDAMKQSFDFIYRSILKLQVFQTE